MIDHDTKAREEFQRINRARERRNTEELRRRLAEQEAMAVVDSRIRSAWWSTAIYGALGAGIATTAIGEARDGNSELALAVGFAALVFYLMMLSAIRSFHASKRDLAALQRSTRSR